MAIPNQLTETQTSDITLSERAASELKTLIEENNKQNAALRVWVAGGGCSGLQYGMALDDEQPEEGDVVMSDQGVKIYVDQMSLRYMVGAVVDYVDDTLLLGHKVF